MSEDNVSLDLLQRRVQQLEEEKRSLPLNSSGGGGTSDDMEARVKALEGRVDKIDGKLDTLLRDSSEIKGRIANMPSTWQMIAICGTMIGIVLATGAALLGILRMLLP